MTIRENGKVARELSKGHAEPGRGAGEGRGTPGLRAEHRSWPRGQSPGKQQRGGTFPAVAEASEGGPHARMRRRGSPDRPQPAADALAAAYDA